MTKEAIIDMLVKIFARPFLFRMWELIHGLSIRFMGIGNYDEEGNITGEKKMLAWILKKYKLTNFFDVGANNGQYSEMIKLKNPDITVFAFEPHPKTFRRLSDTAKKYERFHAFNLAIGNPKAGNEQKIKLYDYAHGEGSEHASVHKEIFNEVYNTENIIEFDVDLISLSDFCKENQIKKISFLKIDTEGNEIHVLKGVEELIKHSNIDFIHFEFNVTNLGKTRFYDFWSLLNENYFIYRLLPTGLAQIKVYSPRQTEIFAYQNFLAVNRKIS
jgi:FkbM family methyltransferase